MKKLNNSGCLMIKLKENPLLFKGVNIINPEDIVEIETQFHCTVIYGLSINSIDLNEFIETVKPLIPKTINLFDISLFQNEHRDVLKFGVELTPELNMLRTCVKMFPNEETFPEYSPHVTIAYLKPTTGKKYTVNQFKENIKLEVEGFILSWEDEFNNKDLKIEIKF